MRDTIPSGIIHSHLMCELRVVIISPNRTAARRMWNEATLCIRWPHYCNCTFTKTVLHMYEGNNLHWSIEKVVADRIRHERRLERRRLPPSDSDPPTSQWDSARAAVPSRVPFSMSTILKNANVQHFGRNMRLAQNKRMWVKIRKRVGSTSANANGSIKCTVPLECTEERYFYVLYCREIVQIR